MTESTKGASQGVKVKSASSRPTDWWFPLPAFLICIAVLGADGQNRTTVKPSQAAPLIHSLKGSDLFQVYCAPCHGLNGKGDGPVAPALKVKPPDLTALALGNKGRFPTERVRQTIAGELVVPAHGSREMPIWGPVFHQVEEDVDRGHVRLQNLVEYLQSIQSLPPAKGTPGNP